MQQVWMQLRRGWEYEGVAQEEEWGYEVVETEVWERWESG
jgi:hypothetical protein